MQSPTGENPSQQNGGVHTQSDHQSTDSTDSTDRIPRATFGYNTPAFQKQVGGDHYRDMPIQVTTFLHANSIGFLAGNVVKYVCRYERKGGLVDLEKAKHYIDMLIEAEGG
jgi:hypothetical protein